MVGNAVLVLVRHEQAFPMVVSVVLGGTALVIAGLVIVYSWWRSAIVRQPDDAIEPARAAVITLGCVVCVLCAAATGALVVWA